MGLLQWLGLSGDGTPAHVKVDDDVVWVKADIARDQFCAEIQNRLARHNLVLAVAHFPAVFARVQETLTEQGIGSELIDRPVTATELLGEVSATSPPRILLAPAIALQGADPVEDGQVDYSKRVSLLVRERHPLASADEALLDFAAGMPAEVFVQHFVSLEDEMLQHFAGLNVKQLLTRFGLDEHDRIEGHTVSQAIKRAQKQIEEKAQGNQPAETASEWFRKNMPQTE